MNNFLIAAFFVAAIAALSFGYLLAKRNDELAELRNKAKVIVSSATGGRINDPLAPFSAVVGAMDSLTNSLRKAGELSARRSLEADPTNGMTTTERAVLCAVTNSGTVKKLGDIAAETSLSEATVGLIVRWLKLRGLVTLGQLTDDDGEMAGRGYYLTQAGIEARKRLVKPPVSRGVPKTALV